MKKSKYLNQTFNVLWKCTKVNIYRVQPAFLKGSKVRSARPHHQTYSYTFDNLVAPVSVTLNANQAAKVYRGEVSVTDLLDRASEVVIKMEK